MTDAEIRTVFEGAGDFETRILRTGDNVLYAYFIDGLVTSSFVAQYIFRPAVEELPENVHQAYEAALRGAVYNAVVRPCRDLQDVASKIVNGFCVVLFPGAGPSPLRCGPVSAEARIHRKWKIRLRVPKTHLWKPSGSIPASCAAICGHRICVLPE